MEPKELEPIGLKQIGLKRIGMKSMGIKQIIIKHIGQKPAMFSIIHLDNYCSVKIINRI